MFTEKLGTKQTKSNSYLDGLDDYDNWVGINYSQKTIAIDPAKMLKTRGHL